jgi:glycosyltransferase involved in cell wall biosynthesis
MRLSLILPLYNECSNLRRNFRKIYKAVNDIGDSEIILAEDGSTDCTKEYARKLSRLKNVRLISSKQRLGRGRALKNAIRIANGRTIGYIDIDLAVPVGYIGIALNSVEQGNKMVVGSRYGEGSKAKRSAKRLIASIGYNSLLRLLLKSGVKDHQCGFKFWNAKFIKSLSGEIKDNHWFFDSESIVRAEWKGVPVLEMPVEWREQKGTKVTNGDVAYFIRSIMRLRAEKR